MGIKLTNGMEVEVINAKESFLKLLDQYNIRVPELQRDYAYGRDRKQDSVKTDKRHASGDESTKIIRESIVIGAKEALDNRINLNLNFIYGVKHDDGEYSPIDGQQRLTTLFLLYWYIYQRKGDIVALDKLKEGFSYATRDTSKRFCANVCQDMSLDFGTEEISGQIEECAWFANAFKKDPTVWSMLVVLDAIHSVFKDVTDAEVDSYVSLLESTSCPIEIETLTVTALGNEEDLYIKMNGRGKQLSDFEIFKSLLQKADELKDMLGGAPASGEISSFIGKFNTVYSQLFNAVIKKPLIVEKAMFAFLRNYLMCNYFSQASKDGILEKVYRDDCGKFRFFNGKVLFAFFSDPDYFGYYSEKGLICPLDINKESFKSAELVLAKMSEYYNTYNTLDFDSNYYKIEDRIAHLVDERYMNADFIDFAIFEFISKFDCPKTDDEKKAFSIWKRFVFNIASNIDLKGSNESLIKIVRVVKETINAIVSFSEQDVLRSIKEANKTPLVAKVSLMKPQLDEESLKAELILDDSSWKTILLNAEGYYVGGQIGFLLEMSKDLSGKCVKKSFEELFEASKKVWDKDRRIKRDEDCKKISKAFLCANDMTLNRTSHLIHLTSNTYEIPMTYYDKLLQNYTDDNKTDRCAQWEILKSLLDKVIAGETVSDAADDLIKGRGTLEEWKEYFVANELFDCNIGAAINFSNHIYYIENDWLMLSKRSVRSKNMSLKTLMLYREMKANGMIAQLNSYPKQEILNEQGNPYRTIGYKGFNIGYNNSSQEYLIIESGVKKKNIPDILVEIKKL